MKKKAPVVKNQEFDAEVIDLTYQGNGVVKVDDFPIFVTNAVPGEKIRVGITKVTTNYAFGRVVKTLEASPNRNNDVNSAALTTGIAPLAHLKYDAQLKFKQQQISELFRKQHVDVNVAPTIGMENPTGYRNKAQIPAREIKGQLTTGFFRRGSHRLMPIEDFYIQDPEIDKAIVIIRDILRKFHVAAYDEVHHKGVIRNIMVRRGYYSHEMMVVLVTRSKRIPGANIIIPEIKNALPEVTSIIQNVNQDKTNVILGDVNHVLWGNKVIKDTLFDKTFAIGPNSFYQVNPQTTEVLYALAAKKAELKLTDTVIDAYSGIGTIGLTVANQVKQVLGVEVIERAVIDAQKNVANNHVENASFITADAPEQMRKWQQSGIKADVIFVDPPRRGLTNELLDAVTEIRPKRFVYVSCNPETMARDAKYLIEKGFHIKGDVQPLDQFPQTAHVEVVTVFEPDN